MKGLSNCRVVFELNLGFDFEDDFERGVDPSFGRFPGRDSPSLGRFCAILGRSPGFDPLPFDLAAASMCLLSLDPPNLGRLARLAGGGAVGGLRVELRAVLELI